MDKKKAVIKRISEMKADDFWDWVRGWLDPETIMEMVKDWSDDLIDEEYEYFYGDFLEGGIEL